jgi:hypothetical protein
VEDNILINIIDNTPIIIQVIMNQEYIIKILNTIANTINKKNNNPTHTLIIALSHHVFLNNFQDSFIASFGHILFIIISGKEKKVSIFHIPHTIQIIIFQIIEFSQNLFCNIFNIVVTNALIADQIIICFKCFIASFKPSHSLLSFHSFLL